MNSRFDNVSNNVIIIQNISYIVVSHKTVFTDHNFSRERRAEADSNRGPSAYRPEALSIDQTSSHSDSVINDRVTVTACRLVCLFVFVSGFFLFLFLKSQCQYSHRLPVINRVQLNQSSQWALD